MRCYRRPFSHYVQWILRLARNLRVSCSATLGPNGAVHAIKWSVQRARYMTLPSWGTRCQPKWPQAIDRGTGGAPQDTRLPSSSLGGLPPPLFQIPHRRLASVRGRRKVAYMMSVGLAPGRPSRKRAQTGSVGDRVISGVARNRVPVGDFIKAVARPQERPSPIGTPFTASNSILQRLPCRASTEIHCRPSTCDGGSRRSDERLRPWPFFGHVVLRPACPMP